MLFSSPIFIFVFLPIMVGSYFLLNRYSKSRVGPQLFLILGSFFFYGYWNWRYLPVLLISISGSYLFGRWILAEKKHKKTVLILGVFFNLGILGYFKYTDFFLETVNYVFKTNIPLLKLVLPLALSFCTFQQIAYLVDLYKGKAKDYGVISYFLFVSFFPQLIAGPIVHHKEMMPQFDKRKNRYINWNNILLGLSIFSLGLFKKVVIADSLSIWVNEGYENYKILDFWDSWKTTLSYTFQLYYDFSGYADMAIGAALMFNIRLPVNFNSPYKATNVQEFWARWHMTLSRWLRDYVYIPLGGSRTSEQPFLNKIFTLRNLFITALASGIWHGAGWSFVVWGALHGLANVVHRIWQYCGFKMNKYLGWLCTFMFVHFAWVFFRADDISVALRIIKVMIGRRDGVCFNPLECDSFKELTSIIDLSVPLGRAQFLLSMPYYLFVLGIIWLLSVTLKNTTYFYEHQKAETLTIKQVSWLAILFGISVVAMQLSSSPVFLYFNF